MKPNTKSVRIFADKHLENIRSTFKTLYEDEILTDCSLICKGGSVKVHKIILASCSPYFRKVFADHVCNNTVFIMYGVTFDQLKDLIALIYKGCIDIPSDHLSSVFDLAEELEVSGILVEGKDTNYSQHGKDDNSSRQKLQGQKRLSVHSTLEEDISATKVPKNTPEILKSPTRIKSDIAEIIQAVSMDSVKKVTNNMEMESVEPLSEASSSEQFIGHPVDEQSTLSAWARKERKFKCEQCPSSFKRASHLSRHQLVHTGERPFPCDQCDKAFSRHDKLKNHIQKTHELDILNEALPPDSLYTIGHVQILTPEQTMIEMAGTINTSTDDYKPYLSADEDEDNEDDDASTSNSLDFKPPSERRKHRGRPRKHPEKIHVGPKRPRGRPRKFPPIDSIPKMKRPRGRPRIRPLAPKMKRPVGRPRIRPLAPKMKRPVGRPRIIPLDYNSDEEKDTKLLGKYNILNGITSDPPPEASILEPLVQIKMEKSDGTTIHEIPGLEVLRNQDTPKLDVQNSEIRSQEIRDKIGPEMEIISHLTEPEIQIIEDSVTICPAQNVPQASNERAIKQEHRSFFENIGLFENNSTVAKIGECTISVSSNCGSNVLSTNKSLDLE